MPSDGASQHPDSAVGLGAIAAVVVNYETPSSTRRAVASLLDSERRLDELIVVDNSAARQPGALSTLPGRVRYVPTAGNLGFSGGVNVGIRLSLAAGASAVLLVNSDAVVEPNLVGTLEASLMQLEEAGIAGPLLRSPRSQRVTSRGIAYNRRTGRMHDRASAFDTTDRRAAVEVVDAVSGCVMLIRRAVFERIGLFDEFYFFGFEDIDFCVTAARSGFASILVTGATAWHQGSQSIGPDSPRRLYFAARNHLRLARRLSGTGRVGPAARALGIVAMNVAHALRSPAGSWPSRLLAVAAGTRDHWYGRYGEGPDR